MTQKTENWSKEWKGSKNPSKQRKYRRNAPKHVQDKLLSARLSDEIRDELETKTLPLRRGDRVQVMTGKFEGSKGIIRNIGREEQKVYIDGLSKNRQDGTEIHVPFAPSNLQVVALSIEDEKRIERYEEADIASIEVDEEEVEEVLEAAEEEDEMMKQMQAAQQMQDMDEEELEELEEEIDEEQLEQMQEEAEEETEDEDIEEDIEEELEETEEELEKSEDSEDEENKEEK